MKTKGMSVCKLCLSVALFALAVGAPGLDASENQYQEGVFPSIGGELALPPTGSATLTLNLQEPDACFDEIGAITITVDVTDLTCCITGAQFFLEFDHSAWRVFIEQSDGGISPGTGWTEFTEDVDNDNGVIEYALWRFDEACGDMRLATITMVPVAEDCNVWMWFDTPHSPPNKLSGSTCTIVPTDLDLNSDQVNNDVVIDFTAPDCTPPGDINTNADASTCGAVVDPGQPACTDNCDTNGIDCTCARDDSLDCFSDAYPAGATGLTWTCADDCGNESITQQTVTVSDDEDPTFDNCPGNIDTNADANTCGAVVTWDPITCSDNCGTCDVTCDYSRGDFFPVGTTTVTCSADDGNGNTAPCTFDVQVSDAEDPTFDNCPAAEIQASNDASTCGAVVTWPSITCSDNCLTCSVTCSHDSGDLFDVGTTGVVCVAEDGAGNTSTCGFNVVVTDDEDPQITCPANKVEDNITGTCLAVVDPGMATCTDNCGACSIECERSDSQDCFADPYPVGVTTLTWTCTDGSGNTDVCQQSVVVLDAEDPTFDNCPTSGFEVPNDAGTCGAIVTWPEITCSDNCLTCSVTCSHDPGDFFDVGTTGVICVAEDGAIPLNTTTCGFKVVVTDDEPPMFDNCPGNIDTNADANTCGAVVTWDPITCSDNCGTCDVTCDYSRGDFFPVGTTTVTCTADDGRGNTAPCTFDVTVSDVQNPWFDDCPTNALEYPNDAGTCGAIVTWNDNASDDCDVDVLVTCEPLGSGDLFPVGTTGVICVAEDDSGNTTTCGFDVIVTDGENPVIDSCPVDIEVPTDIGTCGGAYVDWTKPGCVDNCPTCNVTCDHDPGGWYDVGTTGVCCEAEDGYGNTDGCCFNIVVLDGHELVVDVELAGAFVTPLTRCITFELSNCAKVGPVVIEEELVFDGGGGLNPTASATLSVPCGAYDCITARDELHTLRRTDDDDFGVTPVVGNQYVADFTDKSGTAGDDDSLLGGNCNDDCYIDVEDFSCYVGTLDDVVDPNTDCNSTGPHCDFNGNGIVDASFDFSFVANNFFEWSDVNCCNYDPICDPNAKGRSGDGPRTEISVAELRERGLGYAAVADLNHDGMVDMADMEAFAGGVRPGDTTPVPERTAVTEELERLRR